MNVKDMRVVFMGTPEFAVASLDALVKAGVNIVAVVTAADKPAGRGMKITSSAVKQYAESAGIRILQPLKLKDPGFIEQLKDLKADLQVVVAFRMLPEIVWNMPPMGTINLHGSLLPQYRGAAPINWAIINGETETGVTTFRLKHEIDTGDMLLQESLPIGEDETAGELHDRMKITGANLLVKTITQLAEGSLQSKPQLSEEDLKTAEGIKKLGALKHAPKIFTETCEIDFAETCDEVHNLIRGLSPFPGAFTKLNGKLFKIYRSKKEAVKPTVGAGKFETDEKSFLRFATKDGWIYALEVQMEGKRRMAVGDFLRGNDVK